MQVLGSQHLIPLEDRGATKLITLQSGWEQSLVLWAWVKIGVFYPWKEYPGAKEEYSEVLPSRSFLEEMKKFDVCYDNNDMITIIWNTTFVMQIGVKLRGIRKTNQFYFFLVWRLQGHIIYGVKHMKMDYGCDVTLLTSSELPDVPYIFPKGISISIISLFLCRAEKNAHWKKDVKSCCIVSAFLAILVRIKAANWELAPEQCSGWRDESSAATQLGFGYPWEPAGIQGAHETLMGGEKMHGLQEVMRGDFRIN